MTQLAARAGAVLHNIARIKPTLLNNVDFKIALDMRYNLVLGNCELNMIEFIWGRSKKFVRERTNGRLDWLVGKVGEGPGIIFQSYGDCNVPKHLVCKYARKVREYMEIYRSGTECSLVRGAQKK